MLSKLHFFFFLYFYLILSRVILLGKEKVSKQKNTILYFSAFFPENAGYHWRVKKWVEILEKEGYSVDVVCAINKEEFYLDEVCFNYRVLSNSMIRSVPDDFKDKIFSYNSNTLSPFYQNELEKISNKKDAIFGGNLIKKMGKIFLHHFKFYKYE